MLFLLLVKIFLTTLIGLNVNSQSYQYQSQASLRGSETDDQSQYQSPTTSNSRRGRTNNINSNNNHNNNGIQSEGVDCVDPSLIHNLRNNIIEVPSRFEKIRNCRKSNGILISLVGNKSFKYGYNLKEKVDTRLVALLQTKPRCSLESTSASAISRIFCPTRKPNGPWISLADFLLCDGIKNCPNGEDEKELFCGYHKLMKRELQAKFIESSRLPQLDEE